MKIPLRTNVKVVAPVIVILLAGLPLCVAMTAKSRQVAQVLGPVAALVFLALAGYFLWTMLLTRLDISEDIFTVTSPATTRRFIIPDDIQKVHCDRSQGESIRDVYLENVTGRYVFMEGKYLLPADSKLAVILADAERQVSAS